MASASKTADTPRHATDLLDEIEAPLAALNTRLSFLADYFSKTGATMPDGALYLFLADCDQAAREAQGAWNEARADARTLRLVPEEVA